MGLGLIFLATGGPLDESDIPIPWVVSTDSTPSVIGCVPMPEEDGTEPVLRAGKDLGLAVVEEVVGMTLVASASVGREPSLSLISPINGCNHVRPQCL